MSTAAFRARGFGAMVQDLVQTSAQLLRAEIRLARMELGAAAAADARGTIRVAVGGVLLMLGSLSLVAGAVLLVGDQWIPRDRYWLAALGVVVIAGVSAAWLARRGLASLSPAELAPTETLETLREDKEWLKRQLT